MTTISINIQSQTLTTITNIQTFANTWFSFAQEKDKIIGLILLLLNKNEHGNYSQYR